MSRNILLAEDEHAIASLYKIALEEQPHVAVTIVGTGREAIDALARERFDLALIDLLMPDMDGFAVIAELKKNNIRIPVAVVLTNYGDDMNRKRCHDLGAQDFLVKSDTGGQDLWEKVKKYLPVE